MLKDLKPLTQLQAFDSQIDEREKKKERLPVKLALSEKRVEEINRGLQEAREELRELQKGRRHEERELEAQEIELEKYQRQLYQVKDNRAYAALEEEIARAKEKNAESEEKILNSLETEEERTKGLQEIERRLTEEKEELARREKEVGQEIEVLDQEIAGIAVVREEVAGRISSDSLTRYEKLRQGKGGLAIVSLEGSSCGGCHMDLPPQVVNEVKKGDRFIFCEACNRILYRKEE